MSHHANCTGSITLSSPVRSTRQPLLPGLLLLVLLVGACSGRLRGGSAADPAGSDAAGELGRADAERPMADVGLAGGDLGASGLDGAPPTTDRGVDLPPQTVPSQCTCSGFTDVSPGGVAGQRGRVRVDAQNNVVADNGCPLRGETPRSNHKPGPLWDTILSKYRLNALRLLIYREPMAIKGACINDCSGTLRTATDFDKNGNQTLEPDEKANYLKEVVNTHIAQIDSWVAYTRAKGVYLMIDYHPVLSHNAFDARQWWAIIAPRYANETHVLYELINEPQGGKTPYTAALVALEQELVQMVRKVAPETHIVAWTFNNVVRPDMVDIVAQAPGISYGKASVGYHAYGLPGGQPNLDALQAKYPVLQTEAGQTNNDLYDDYIAWMEQQGLSWFALDPFRRMEENKEQFGIKLSWTADPFYLPACH